MKPIILLLLLSNSLYAGEFDICGNKDAKCESRYVQSEVLEFNAKVIPVCDEVTYLNDEGVRAIAYYECRVVLDSKTAKPSAIRIKVKPFSASKSLEKPKFDPSKPFTVVE